MRRSGFSVPGSLLACVALATVMCACGGSGVGSQREVKGCQFTRDSVSPRISPLVEIQPPGSGTARTITTTAGLTCGTVLSVAHSGAADFVFGTQARCQLRQGHASHQQAKLISRDPVNALFRLGRGRVVCTFGTSAKRIPLCGLGTMLPNGGTEVTAACDLDPIFRVAVFAGSVRVIDPDGTAFLLRARQELTFNFRTRRPAVAASECSLSGTALFAAQAKAMQLTIRSQCGQPQNGLNPQAITFTSQPPGNAQSGETYPVTAAGGGSGNPVTYTIDPASAAVCKISGNVVNFLAHGACIIDANQAGSAQYQAAPQVQQEVPVGAISQTIAFGPPPTTAMFAGSTYQVTATGGSSGNPVVFTIDPSSKDSSGATVCTLSGSTVTFSQPGTCTVDANQAGDDIYAAAPQAQQSVIANPPIG